jgi:hypothetical protein
MSVLRKIIGSRLRAKLLGWLFLHADERYYVRQLESILDEDPANLSRELARLESLGVLVGTTEGRQKYYRANHGCPFFEELRGLVLKTEGLVDVLRVALRPLADRIGWCFVYGSHASGESTAASDIDLLVVGDVDGIELHRAISKAEAQLVIPVHYTLLSREEFGERKQDKGGFLSSVLRGPRMEVIGNAGKV